MIVNYSEILFNKARDVNKKVRSVYFKPCPQAQNLKALNSVFMTYLSQY